MKAYIRAPYSKKCLLELEEVFEEIVYDPWTKNGKRFYEDEMLENLIKIKPDILITELDRISEKVVKNYKNLKIIGDCRSNPANIDVKACTRANIPIICTPARNAIAVAEYIVGMILLKWRNLTDSMNWIRDEKWVKGTTPYYEWMGEEINSKKVGIIGMGAVGKHLASLLYAFGAEITYYDPYIEKIANYKIASLEEIFSQSDMVSLHLPANEQTKNLIGKKYLKLMKKDALFINTSRSLVVNNNDLMDMINNESIGAVILDVLPEEPPKKEDLKFIDNKNVFLTPHIGGATYQVTNHQSEILNRRLKKWLKKEELKEIIYNKELYQ